MAKEVNLYKFCGSPQMKEKLWRDMFISYIFGVDMPENISVCRLPDDIRDILSAKDFSPALASLLILYGGGYLDNDTLAYMAGDCDNYADEIAVACHAKRKKLTSKTQKIRLKLPKSK